MNLKNSDEIMLRMAILRDNPKYTAEQVTAINDCINVVINTPTETNYRYMGEGVESATKPFKRGILYGTKSGRS